MTRNDVSFMNGSVSSEVTAAADAGLVLRLVDNLNYYLAGIYDSNGTDTQNRIRIYRRVSGTYTLLSEGFVTLTRGTAYRIVFTANGSTLSVSVNGTQVTSVTDTALLVAGKIGVRANFGPAAYNDLIWSYE